MRLSECEMDLSEKELEMGSGDIAQKVRRKADEQDELANKGCVGGALGQVWTEKQYGFFADTPPSQKILGKTGLHLHLCLWIRSCF